MRLTSGRNQNSNIYHSSQIHSDHSNHPHLSQTGGVGGGFQRPNYNDFLNRSPPKYLQTFQNAPAPASTTLLASLIRRGGKDADVFRPLASTLRPQSGAKKIVQSMAQVFKISLTSVSSA